MACLFDRDGLKFTSPIIDHYCFDKPVGEMSKFYRKLLEEITPWLSDDNFRVRNFANQVYHSLQTSIEQREAEEKLRKKNW